MTSLDLLKSTPTPVQLQLRPFKMVNLTLVGCGGTGSHLVSGLGALACELRARNIQVALTLVDPDRVEAKNVGRQLFAASEIGEFKATVLAQRLIAAYGLAVDAWCQPIAAASLVPSRWEPEVLSLVIGAVDNAAARAELANAVARAGRCLWWLDCGNENHSGQVALGNCMTKQELKGAVALGLTDRLPAPALVFPDLVKAPKPRANKVGKAASCAELTAAGEQGLMTNRMVAAWALSLLYDLLVARDIHYFALAFYLRWGGTKAYSLDAPTLAQACGLKETQLLQRPARRNTLRTTRPRRR